MSPADPTRYPLWPTVAITVLTGCAFTIFKFLVIAAIALAHLPGDPVPLPFEWMRSLVVTSGNISEMVSQGLASTLTVGILLGYLVNAPLAGAWRVGPLFTVAVLGMTAGAILSLLVNPWLIALLVGASYGTACAARGKSVPLLGGGCGRNDTFVSGIINAALVVGLLAGTVLGNALGEWFISDPHSPTKAAVIFTSPVLAHGLLVAFLLACLAISTRIRLPPAEGTGFLAGLRSLIGITFGMLKRHPILLVSGGISWGVASAASLAVLVYGVNDLGMKPVTASTLAVFPAVGAILGNLASGRLERRRYVLTGFGLLATTIALFPLIVTGWGSAAVVMVVVGFLFGVSTNVIDARFLALAGREGKAGYGGTVFSMVHNVLILMVSLSLAIGLSQQFLNSKSQFFLLAGWIALALVIAAAAKLNDRLPS